jgi:hypothetical protein
VYGAGKHAGARVYPQFFFRHEGLCVTPNVSVGNDETLDKGAAGPGTPGRSVSLQVKTPRKGESGILLANIEGLFPQRERHKIGMLREMAYMSGICMIALTD